MTEREPRDLEDLDARLRAAQRRSAGAPRGPGEVKGLASGALGLALRLSVELVSALVVGVGIGLLLDRWLGTKPWLLILFFILGSAAGLLNLFRVMSGERGVVGFRRGSEDRDKAAGAPADEDDE